MAKRKRKKNGNGKKKTEKKDVAEIKIQSDLALADIEREHEKSISIIESVEKTHYGLGRMALMEIISDIAGKTLLVIGSAGTGKSTVMRAVERVIPRGTFKVDSLTVSGLRHFQEKLNSANLTILVDDLSKAGTQYSESMTLVTLAELVYSGYFVKATSSFKIEIYGFSGSAIVNLQPIILKKCTSTSEWESDIRDKTIRWYNLRFPTDYVPRPPKISVDYDYRNLEEIELSNEIRNSTLYQKLVSNFLHQHTFTRAYQHANDMLRAIAILNDREKVSWTDVVVLEWLTRNLRLEPYLFTKTHLEGSRQLDPDILPLLGLCATYGEFSIHQIMVQFQIAERTAYDIIRKHNDLVVLRERESTVVPSPEAIEILRDCGEW
ncbi:MAG: hypothetical protein DRN49_04215 [Thaumarchaeota archaeon]|nr:MAG: hypothetical protein DRN49_04215 [Nitrososphaerota archaeon]